MAQELPTTPRWVKLSAMVVAVLILLFALHVIVLRFIMPHGPAGHMGPM